MNTMSQEGAVIQKKGTRMSEPQDKLATILFVDDEINILAPLNRLFRPLGYRIFMAECGVE
ncbi:MAG: hypothetical protein ABIR84_08535, partial [Candidatus Nitrotoga sp.]